MGIFRAKSVFIIKLKIFNVLLVLRNFSLETRIQVIKCFVRFHDYLFWEVVAKHEYKFTYKDSQSLISRNGYDIANIVSQ